MASLGIPQQLRVWYWIVVQEFELDSEMLLMIAADFEEQH